MKARPPHPPEPIQIISPTTDTRPLLTRGVDTKPTDICPDLDMLEPALQFIRAKQIVKFYPQDLNFTAANHILSISPFSETEIIKHIDKLFTQVTDQKFIDLFVTHPLWREDNGRTKILKILDNIDPFIDSINLSLTGPIKVAYDLLDHSSPFLVTIGRRADFTTTYGITTSLIPDLLKSYAYERGIFGEVNIFDHGKLYTTQSQNFLKELMNYVSKSLRSAHSANDFLIPISFHFSGGAHTTGFHIKTEKTHKRFNAKYGKFTATYIKIKKILYFDTGNFDSTLYLETKFKSNIFDVLPTELSKLPNVIECPAKCIKVPHNKMMSQSYGEGSCAYIAISNLVNSAAGTLDKIAGFGSPAIKTCPFLKKTFFEIFHEIHYPNFGIYNDIFQKITEHKETEAINLIKKCSDINKESVYGYRILTHAFFSDTPKVILHLLENHVEKDYKTFGEDKIIDTVWYTQAFAGVQDAIDKKDTSSIYYKIYENWRALDSVQEFADHVHFYQFAFEGKNWQLLDLLLYNKDLSILECTASKSFLHFTVEYQKLEFAQRFLKMRWDKAFHDCLMAAEGGKFKYNVDFIGDIEFITPLRFAVKEGNIKAVRLLCEHEANPGLVTDSETVTTSPIGEAAIGLKYQVLDYFYDNVEQGMFHAEMRSVLKHTFGPIFWAAQHRNNVILDSYAKCLDKSRLHALKDTKVRSEGEDIDVMQFFAEQGLATSDTYKKLLLKSFEGINDSVSPGRRGKRLRDDGSKASEAKMPRGEDKEGTDYMSADPDVRGEGEGGGCMSAASESPVTCSGVVGAESHVEH